MKLLGSEILLHLLTSDWCDWVKTAPVAASDMCSHEHTRRAWWDWQIGVSLSQTWHISSSTHTHEHTHALGCLPLMFKSHTHTHKHKLVCECIYIWKLTACAHTGGRRCICCLSVCVPPDCAADLLRTVGAPRLPVGSVSPSGLGYSARAGQFQYVTPLSSHRAHGVEMKHSGPRRR